MEWNIIKEKQEATKTTKREERTMKVSYNGFTGELVKLEKDFDHERACVAYNLDIRDREKDVTYSFSGVKLSDVKFLGGAVAFGE